MDIRREQIIGSDGKGNISVEAPVVPLSQFQKERDDAQQDVDNTLNELNHVNQLQQQRKDSYDTAVTRLAVKQGALDAAISIDNEVKAAAFAAEPPVQADVNPMMENDPAISS